jgi:Flp pilus assembly protein protease CpaA
MPLASPGTQLILPATISLLVVTWLWVCAIIDARTRQVPNALTLPAIPLALLAAWLTRGARGDTPYEFLFHLGVMTLPLFVAWRSHLMGGADLKIFLVLAIANPLLVVAAWIGVVLYFISLLTIQRRRPVRFAGVPGFTLGAGLFTLGQIALLFTQHLTA